jgi:sugar diacid utilization regulator
MAAVPSADVQAQVDDLAERLQRSVVVDDPHLGMLYSSVHFGDEDPIRVDAMLKRRADSRAIGHIFAQGVLTWTRPGVIPANDEIGLHARVCVPVRWQGELIGFVMVMDSDGSVTTAQTAEISSVAGRIAPLLTEELKAADGTAHQTVLDLVSRDGALRRRALAELASTDIARDLDSVTAIRLTIRGENSDASQAHMTASLRSALMLPKPTGSRVQLSAVEGRNAVVIIGSIRPLTVDSARAHARRLLARVDDLSSGRFKAVAGIGPALPGLESAHEAAELAALAMRAAVMGLSEAAATWEDLGPYGPLLRIPSDELDRQALPAEVQRLLQVDRDGHLLESLRAYLDAAGSAPDASTALRIHRTTLYYRLTRIEKLLEIDLSDGRTRLTLHLGMALLDLMPGHGSTKG